MRSVIWVLVLLTSSVLAQAPSADDLHRYDGTWDTVLSCPNDAGAMGFSFRFDSVVKDGALHGAKGTKGQAGWLEINGKIGTDGVSHLLVNGLVGAAEYAVGKRPAGTEYAYKVDAIFADDQGTGKRVEGRPCDVTFRMTKRGTGAD